MVPFQALARAARNRARIVTVAAVAVTLTGIGGAAAASAGSTPAAPLSGNPIVGCVNGENARPYSYVPWRGMWGIFTNDPGAYTCPEGSWKASFASEKQLIGVNNQVAANTSGIQALQNVGTASQKVLQDPAATPQSIATGGSFLARATGIGTLQLPAGTYLVNFSAKATPNAASGSAQIFPQFFVYNQAKNASFTGNLFNVGAGALEPYNGSLSSSHDSYFSGSDVVTVPAGGLTLYVYAFGYDSNNGGGTYALDAATIQAVRLAG